MALTPRCATNGSGSLGTVTPALTGWTNCGAGVSGTAPQAGDLVLLVATTNATGTPTGSQTGGTGTWTFESNGDQNGTTTRVTAFLAYRVFDGTETAPTFSFGSGSSRNDWALIALSPDSSATPSIDSLASVLIDSTSGTTYTPNSAIASGSGEVSCILSGMGAASSGATAISFTAPAGWTNPSGGTGNNNGSGSSKSFAANVLYATGQSGTVAPGAVTTNVSVVGIAYHVLVIETANATAPAATAQGLGAATPASPTANASAAAVSAQAVAAASASAATGGASAPAAAARGLAAGLAASPTGSASVAGVVPTGGVAGANPATATATGGSVPNPPNVQYPTSATVAASMRTAAIVASFRAATVAPNIIRTAVLAPTTTRTAAITSPSRTAAITTTTRTAAIVVYTRTAVLNV